MNNALSIFKSATIQLTFWYAGIIVVISLLFSIVIFSIATSEVGSRITTFQQTFHFPTPAEEGQMTYRDLRDLQILEAQNNLIASLIVTNLLIWFAGGVGSYYLARRTLRPIEEAHDAQSRFTSDASHELRTPLASMKLELEVALRDTDSPPAELREVLTSNLEEVNKLTRLSHTLLQLSRLEHDKIVRERVHLDDAITATLRQFSHDDRTVTRTGPSGLDADANQSNVEELLTILLDNAFKYSPADSAIQLVTFRRRQMVGFKIINEGKGIATENLPHIFDRFYRTERSRTVRRTKDYGLGLSLAKKLVELHNGDLSVSSAPNALTTFTVLLPQRPKKLAKKEREMHDGQSQ